MTVTEAPVAGTSQAEQQLGAAILAQGMRLAGERDAEREAHAETRHRLEVANAEIRRLAVLVEGLERQVEQAQQAHAAMRGSSTSRYRTQL